MTEPAPRDALARLDAMGGKLDAMRADLETLRRETRQERQTLLAELPAAVAEGLRALWAKADRNDVAALRLVKDDEE